MSWDALTAISNSLLFLSVTAGLFFTYLQVRAMKNQVTAIKTASEPTLKQISVLKDMCSLALVTRLDDRLCTERMQELLVKIKDWDPDNLGDEQRRTVMDIIGIFELVGLAIERGYLDFGDAEIMFGSTLDRIYDDYGYKSFIDKNPLYFNYTRRFANRVREVRKEREENAGKLVRP